MLDKKVPYQYAHSQKKQNKLRNNQLKLSKEELVQITTISDS